MMDRRGAGEGERAVVYARHAGERRDWLTAYDHRRNPGLAETPFARRVACPHPSCRAAAGAHCVTRNGRLAGYEHAARVDFARQVAYDRARRSGAALSLR